MSDRLPNLQLLAMVVGGLVAVAEDLTEELPVNDRTTPIRRRVHHLRQSLDELRRQQIAG